MTVVLQPQLLELVYSSLADQDMLHPLGRIDLRDAKLEQVPDGFIIYEAGSGLHKVGWARRSSLHVGRAR